MQKPLLMLRFLFFSARNAMRFIQAAARYFVVRERLAVAAPGAGGERSLGIVLRHQKILLRLARMKKNKVTAVATKNSNDMSQYSRKALPMPNPRQRPERSALRMRLIGGPLDSA
jgi:hypothetical protein